MENSVPTNRRYLLFDHDVQCSKNTRFGWANESCEHKPDKGISLRRRKLTAHATVYAPCDPMRGAQNFMILVLCKHCCEWEDLYVFDADINPFSRHP